MTKLFQNKVFSDEGLRNIEAVNNNTTVDVSDSSVEHLEAMSSEQFKDAIRAEAHTANVMAYEVHTESENIASAKGIARLAYKTHAIADNIITNESRALSSAELKLINTAIEGASALVGANSSMLVLSSNGLCGESVDSTTAKRTLDMQTEGLFGLIGRVISAAADAVRRMIIAVKKFLMMMPRGMRNHDKARAVLQRRLFKAVEDGNVYYDKPVKSRELAEINVATNTDGGRELASHRSERVAQYLMPSYSLSSMLPIIEGIQSLSNPNAIAVKSEAVGAVMSEIAATIFTVLIDEANAELSAPSGRIMMVGPQATFSGQAAYGYFPEETSKVIDKPDIGSVTAVVTSGLSFGVTPNLFSATNIPEESKVLDPQLANVLLASIQSVSGNQTIHKRLEQISEMASSSEQVQMLFSRLAEANSENVEIGALSRGLTAFVSLLSDSVVPILEAVMEDSSRILIACQESIVRYGPAPSRS